MNKKGIIINDNGGCDQEVAKMFNDLCKFIEQPYHDCFNNTNKALYEHYNRRWNKAKGSLKHNYFSMPWTTISIIATLLIVMTLLQTIFSVISAFFSKLKLDSIWRFFPQEIRASVSNMSNFAKQDVYLLVKIIIIISNIARNDKEVLKLSNNLGKFLELPSNDRFNNIKKSLTKSYLSIAIDWCLSLKHNYFNIPWAIVSFFCSNLSHCSNAPSNYILVYLHFLASQTYIYIYRFFFLKKNYSFSPLAWLNTFSNKYYIIFKFVTMPENF